MMTKFKFIIPKIALLLVVGILFFVYKSKYLSNPDKINQAKDNKITYFANYLHSIWTIGPSHDEILACKNLDKTAPINFYRCNKDFLKCALGKKHKFNDQVYDITIANHNVWFKSKDEDYKFKLTDRCHMSYLPQKKYSYGLTNEPQYLWDNLSQNIYIDKFYVSNQDIYNWNPNLIKESNYRANLNLSTDQKIKYCGSKGKKLLEARFFDAASFIYDQDQKNNYFYKHKTSFTKGRSFLSSNDELSIKNCYRAYVKGCEKFYEFKNFDDMSLTWIGINYSLGSHPEEMVNRFDNDLNFKESSMHLDKNSKAHKVGHRINKKDKKGAFRCILQL